MANEKIKKIVFDGLEINMSDYATLDDAKTNAYSSISKKDDYFYELSYDEIDYLNALSYFKNKKPQVNAAGCSAFTKDGALGRNLDWLYSNDAEFFVKTPSRNGMYSVMGVAQQAGMTAEFVDSGRYSDLYKIIPFSLVDGINEKGLSIATLVTPLEKGKTTGTVPKMQMESEICSLMLPRFVLDRFSNVENACFYLDNYVSIYVPTTLHELGYEQHFLLTDKTGDSAVIEFIDNRLKVIKHDKATNFHIDGVKFNEDGSVYTPETQTSDDTAVSVNKITPHGSGLERYNLINERYDSLEDGIDMMNLLEELKYTKSYTRDTVPFRYTEFVGVDSKGVNYTVDTPTSEYDAPGAIVDRAIALFNDRDRDNPVTWQTNHSAVYDCVHGNVILKVQEKEEFLAFSQDMASKDFVRSYVEEQKQDPIQVYILPEPSDEHNGKIRQYIGETNDEYTNGYFYKCEYGGSEPTAEIRQVSGPDEIQDLTVDVYKIAEIAGDEETDITLTSTLTRVLYFDKKGTPVNACRFDKYDRTNSEGIMFYAWLTMEGLYYTQYENVGLNIDVYDDSLQDIVGSSIMSNTQICWGNRNMLISKETLNDIGVDYTIVPGTSEVDKHTEDLSKVAVDNAIFKQYYNVTTAYTFSYTKAEDGKAAWVYKNDIYDDLSTIGITFDGTPTMGESEITIFHKDDNPSIDNSVQLIYHPASGQTGWFQCDTQPSSEGNVSSVNGQTGDVNLLVDDIPDSAKAIKYMYEPYRYGEVVQFIGDSYDGYETGYFYQAVDEGTGRLLWRQLSVQPGGAGDTVTSVNGKTGDVWLEAKEIPNAYEKYYNMPPTSQEIYGMVAKYVGETNDEYTKGHDYECTDGGVASATITQTKGSTLSDLTVDADRFGDMTGQTTGIYDFVGELEKTITITNDIGEAFVITRFTKLDSDIAFGWRFDDLYFFTDKENPQIGDLVYGDGELAEKVGEVIDNLVIRQVWKLHEIEVNPFDYGIYYIGDIDVDGSVLTVDYKSSFIWKDITPDGAEVDNVYIVKNEDGEITINDLSITKDKIADKAIPKSKIDPLARVVYENDRQEIHNKTMSASDNTFEYFTLKEFDSDVVLKEAANADDPSTDKVVTEKALVDTVSKNIVVSETVPDEPDENSSPLLYSNGGLYILTKKEV